MYSFRQELSASILGAPGMQLLEIIFAASEPPLPALMTLHAVHGDMKHLQRELAD